ncbi:Crp/Fnr family transcriptional regulator [Enterococcus rivorum]|uniref:HTH crp-type domain-containing protein n=1 Tax=Enterococcus rivorum TaxID=762845 RepID=A0A1E5KWC6_9ENTE|nr:Crp/Fnr family transcriptional regulator [Enterococcus rivorum]MBP2100550.1 CRP-like cAMP-binding protein [Enterococcus rivorum]OEH82165.1 hypothetical protein BCR26_14295 [Enterococcus rivorum]
MKELDEANKKYNSDFVEKVKKTDVGENLKRIKIKKNVYIDSLIQPGFIYYIETGVVLRSFVDAAGNIKAIDILCAQEVMGLRSLIGRVGVQLEIKALEEVTILIIPEKLILANLQDAYHFLCSNFQYTMSIMYLHWQAMLSFGSERINYALIALAYYVGTEKDGEFFFPPYITHDVIASFASVTRSYVSRHVSKLADDDILVNQAKKMKIKDMDTLIKNTPNYQSF